MNLEQARFNMIEQQIRPWDVLDPGVLSLLARVRREDFVPAAHRTLAFVDTQVPLLDGAPQGACMLEPRVEARLLQELRLQRQERVLEVGAGSGFMACLLGHQAAQVVSLEIRADLAAQDLGQQLLLGLGLAGRLREVAGQDRLLQKQFRHRGQFIGQRGELIGAQRTRHRIEPRHHSGQRIAARRAHIGCRDRRGRGRRGHRLQLVDEPVDGARLVGRIRDVGAHDLTGPAHRFAAQFTAELADRLGVEQ